VGCEVEDEEGEAGVSTEVDPDKEETRFVFAEGGESGSIGWPLSLKLIASL